MDKAEVMKIIDDHDHLAHYGIKGQSWGVRRYQNEDGSLTPEGRKRYGLNTKYSDMSIEDLNRAIKRKQTENQYVSEITKDARKKREDLKGFVRAASDTAGKGGELANKTLFAKNQRDIIEYKQDLTTKKKKLVDDMNAKGVSEAQKKALSKQIADKQAEIDAAEEARKLSKNLGDTIPQIARAPGQYSEQIANVATKGEIQKLSSEAYQRAREMDDETLEKVFNRMKLEKQYDELVNPPKPSTYERGREVLQTLGTVLSIGLTAVSIYSMLKGRGGGDDKKVKQSDLDDGTEFLSHYGVKGMKKGIRRWTNEDGTLTEAGKIHYGLVGTRKANRDAKSATKHMSLNWAQEDHARYKAGLDIAYKNRKSREGLVDAHVDYNLGNIPVNEAYKKYYNERAKANNFLKDLRNIRKDIAVKDTSYAYSPVFGGQIFTAMYINGEGDNFFVGTKFYDPDVDRKERKIEKQLNKFGITKQEIADEINLRNAASNKELGKYFRELMESGRTPEKDLQKIIDEDQNKYTEEDLKKSIESLKKEKEDRIKKGDPDPEMIDLIDMEIEDIENTIKKMKHDDLVKSGEEFLAHYRTKGSKNGVRRYQNEDGSLTPEGYRHYGIDPNGRPAADPRAAIERQRMMQRAAVEKQRSQMAAQKDRIKMQSKQNAYTQKIQQRAAIREARNQAHIDQIYAKQQVRAQRMQNQEEMRMKAESRANMRKNIIKGALGIAAIGAAVGVGYHVLHNRSLDLALAREKDKIRLEHKNAIDMVEAETKKYRLTELAKEQESQRGQTQRSILQENTKRLQSRDSLEGTKYTSDTERLKSKNDLEKARYQEDKKLEGLKDTNTTDLAKVQEREKTERQKSTDSVTINKQNTDRDTHKSDNERAAREKESDDKRKAENYKNYKQNQTAQTQSNNDLRKTEMHEQTEQHKSDNDRAVQERKSDNERAAREAEAKANADLASSKALSEEQAKEIQRFVDKETSQMKIDEMTAKRLLANAKNRTEAVRIIEKITKTGKMETNLAGLSAKEKQTLFEMLKNLGKNTK